MELRKTRVTERSRAQQTVAALSLLALASVSGCVREGEKPVLAVDLLWDKSVQDRFAEGDCDSAGVIWMEYTLENAEGNVVSDSDDDDDDDAAGIDCENGFNFIGLESGDYSLTITGYDDGNQALWNATCDDLTLDRFDVLYACEIDQVAL